MNKFILSYLFFILVITAPLEGHAEWVFVSKSYDGSDYFVDADRIVRKESMITYWTMTNQKPGNELYNSGTKSALMHRVGDCSIKRFKYTQFTFYDQPDLKGEFDIDRKEDKDWTYAQPGSLDEALMNFACSRK